MIEARFEKTFSGWRNEARQLLQKNTPPDQIVWPEQNEQSLFSTLISKENFLDTAMTIAAPETLNSLVAPSSFSVPADFLNLARFVSCVRGSEKWSLLYRLLFRLKNETPHLLKIASDPDVQRARNLMKSVTRDVHKMHAFVRFKRVVYENQEIFMAWHRPEHLTLEEGAPFFARRFGDKPWCIMTPDRSAFWNGNELIYAEGVPQHLFPHHDDFDELWKTYYSAIFNPARIKIKAMKSEMATKYWSTLPEASLIPQLLREAPARLERMANNQNTHANVPATKSLNELYTAARSCRACPLFASAQNLVPGMGPPNAWLMIVGEQPGDQEDQSGLPFVGPAGEVLQEQLLLAGLPREEIYLTNAVKHFKFQRSGTLRKHQKPSGSEMHACRPWLEEEIRKIKPRVIVALGTTAATSVLGRLPKVKQERGQIIRNSALAEIVIISWHPAAILRSADENEKRERQGQLGADLTLAAQFKNDR